MGSRKKKRQRNTIIYIDIEEFERITKKTCFNCNNCLPIGDGDHLCDVKNKIVLGGYEPTDEFYWCEGKHFCTGEE